MQNKIKRVLQIVMYIIKITYNVISWKQKSHYFIPILAIVCVHFTSNAEFKRLLTGTRLVSRPKIILYITSHYACLTWLVFDMIGQ